MHSTAATFFASIVVDLPNSTNENWREKNGRIRIENAAKSVHTSKWIRHIELLLVGWKMPNCWILLVMQMGVGWHLRNNKLLMVYLNNSLHSSFMVIHEWHIFNCRYLDGPTWKNLYARTLINFLAATLSIGTATTSCIWSTEASGVRNRISNMKVVARSSRF